jgi:hypothetical protein
VGHGETYLHPEDILWWSKGGVLHGESPARIAFLRKIVEAGPVLDPVHVHWDIHQGGNDDYRLIYFGIHRPAVKDIQLPDTRNYTVDVIDTWEMTITRLEGTFSGPSRVELPGIPYIALRIQAVD